MKVSISLYICIYNVYSIYLYTGIAMSPASVPGKPEKEGLGGGKEVRNPKISVLSWGPFLSVARV